jgi:hypothetical protein
MVLDTEFGKKWFLSGICLDKLSKGMKTASVCPPAITESEAGLLTTTASGAKYTVNKILCHGKRRP